MAKGSVVYIGLLYLHVSLAFPDLRLPENHLPSFFTNNPNLKDDCERDPSCQYKFALNSSVCWGYEKKCKPWHRLRNPDCSGDSNNWANGKEHQLQKFWSGADFGIISERRSELKMLCKPSATGDSSLQCSKFLQYCKAKNIYLDFSSANILKGPERSRYREDILKDGDVGGHCNLDVKSLKAEGAHKSPLQSWFAELEHYTYLPFKLSETSNCDVVYEKPTFLIKLDAGVNMYHHFCDFVNLYASQHINNSFDTDIHIIMWDTSPNPYYDLFSLTWKAFTDHPIIPLRDLDGKKVCIKDAVFPQLARAWFGLYYNMPLMPGCYGSSLIQAFSEHILFRLSIPQEGPLTKRIRITLLERKTDYRNIINQKELTSALKTVGEYEVSTVQYNRHMPFDDQLKISHNSDIFIGMHGSGLTHMLFQPDWAVIFELYNCEDNQCYFDLARLRGIKYMTWERADKMVQEDEGHHPTLGAHAKFTNYSFDVEEFMKLVHRAADHVRTHPAYVKSTGRQDATLTNHTEL